MQVGRCRRFRPVPVALGENGTHSAPRTWLLEGSFLAFAGGDPARRRKRPPGSVGCSRRRLETSRRPSPPHHRDGLDVDQIRRNGPIGRVDGGA